MARLTVLANDSPHGVVAWEEPNYDIDEPTDTDATLTLHIVRRQGSEGHIRVSYMYVDNTFNCHRLYYSLQMCDSQVFVFGAGRTFL